MWCQTCSQLSHHQQFILNLSSWEQRLHFHSALHCGRTESNDSAPTVWFDFISFCHLCCVNTDHILKTWSCTLHLHLCITLIVCRGPYCSFMHAVTPITVNPGAANLNLCKNLTAFIQCKGLNLILLSTVTKFKSISVQVRPSQLSLVLGTL